MLAMNRSALYLAKQIGTFQCRQGGSISVILLDKIENRGVQGEIITVKRGFARNFLIPKKLAGELPSFHNCFFVHFSYSFITAYATEANKLKYAELFLEVPDLSKVKLNSFKDIVMTFERVSTIGGALFGSVSVADIKTYFNERSVEVDKIELAGGSLKELGTHIVKVDGVNFQINIVEPLSTTKKVNV